MAKLNPVSVILRLLKHPLTIAVLLYIPLMATDLPLRLRLLLLAPVAAVDGDASPEPEGELSESERANRELLKLREQNAAYATLSAQLMQGNAQLQTLARDLPQLSSKAIAARIVRRGDSSNWRHTIYINRGHADGVKPGYLVTVGRTVVGRVLATSGNVSAVSLVSDPELALPVSILSAQPASSAAANVADTEQTRGILRGNGGMHARLPFLSVSNVSAATGVSKGMVVVTNDVSGQAPSGLLVGTVEAVRDRGMFLDVEVKSAMDLELLEVVLVIPHERPTLDDAARLLAGHKHLEQAPGRAKDDSSSNKKRG